MPASYPPNGEDVLSQFERENRLERPLPSRREMHLTDALLVIRGKAWLIAACTVCGVLLGLLATWTTQKRYSSTVTIEVHKEGGNSLSLDDLSGIGSQLGGADQLSVDLLTQQMVIGNENTALKVIESLSLWEYEPFASAIKGRSGGSAATLEEDPAARDRAVRLFQSRLRITLVKGTRLLDVTYTDADPKLAARVANAVIDAYVIEAAQQRYDATARTSTWLTNQLSDLKMKVSQSQKEVSDFRRKTGLLGTSKVEGGPSGEGVRLEYGSLELDRLGDLNRQLTAAEIARISSEALYRITDSQNADLFLGLESSQLAASASGRAFSSSASQDISRLKELRNEQGQIKVELASNKAKYAARNPTVVELENRLAELNRQIADEMRRISRQAKNDFDLAASTENSIRQSVDREKQKVSQLNNSEDQLALLQQEEISSRALYQDLYSKLEAANVIAGVKSSNVTVVNPARVSAIPSRPVPLQNVGLGFLAGLAIGLFGAFATNYRNDTIATPNDISSESGLALLGLVPLFKRPIRLRRTTGSTDTSTGGQPPSAWVLRSPQSATAEAYRQIRTAILLSRPSSPPKTVLFASSLSGDGKTTTCYNSGFSFALQGSRVLLIDADMRKPSLHRELNLPNEMGLSQCLSSDLDPRSVVQQQRDLANLFVITSGPVPPAPSELLGSKRFVDMLRSLENDFDFIFIDGPPILMVTDSVLIGQLVDGIVLVVRSGVTRQVFLRRVLDLLSASRQKLLGIVLNAADVSSAEYRSMYGYYGDGTYYRQNDE